MQVRILSSRPFVITMSELDLTKEIACLRAVLERILRVMDEGLFVDYQMEKFGLIKYKVPEE